MDDMKDASQNEEFKSAKGQQNSIPINSKNRMNFPFEKESRLTFYRSQVIAKGDKIPLVSKDARITNLRQSLVPIVQKNCQQSGQNPMLIEINHQNRNNNPKCRINLHSPRAKNTIHSPLLTCRSAQNLGKKTLRENPYFMQNETVLEENRSVKFIAKIREQICSNVTQRAEKVRALAEKDNEKNMALFIALTERNNQLERELQDSNTTNNLQVNFNQHNQSENLDKSHQDQTFEKKLILKCKDLQLELESKSEQIQKLSKALKDLQLKHVAEVQALRSQWFIESARREGQMQSLRSQLIDMQRSKKVVERKKVVKQRMYQQQIQRYARELANSEQSKNKMILQFEDVLKQRLQSNQKSYMNRLSTQLQSVSSQNTTLQHRVLDLMIKIGQLQQERSNLKQEGDLLHCELSNYVKWNDELSMRNLSMQREVNGLLRVNEELQHERVNALGVMERRCQQHQSMVMSKSGQQMEKLRFQKHALWNQRESKQRLWKETKLDHIRNIQKIRTQLRSSNTALSESKLENTNLRQIFAAKQKQLQDANHQLQQQQLAHSKIVAELHAQVLSQTANYEARIKTYKDRITRLEMEVEEWKFICESNALNNSLIFESKQQADRLNPHIKQYQKVVFQ